MKKYSKNNYKNRKKRVNMLFNKRNLKLKNKRKN